MLRRRAALPEQDVLALPDAALVYRIRHSPRRRSLGLELRADGSLTVAVPRGLTLTVIRQFVESRRAWIEAKRALLAEAAQARRALVPGARLPYLGRELTLEHRPAARTRCRGEGDTLIVAAHPDRLHAAIEAWYRRAARHHFAARVAHYAPQVGRAPRALSIRAQRSRWGSCSSRGALSFNWRLLQAAPEILDYVVVHELCHLLVPNHSPRFWAEVARVLPDYAARRAALRRFGRALAF
jgi:predicted metal-dependent hydrolase